MDPLRRKSAAGFGSFLGEKSVPAKEVCDEPTRLRETESKRQCGTGTSEVQCENGKMRTVFKKSTCSSEHKSLQLGDGSFLDPVGTSKYVTVEKCQGNQGLRFSQDHLGSPRHPEVLKLSKAPHSRQNWAIPLSTTILPRPTPGSTSTLCLPPRAPPRLFLAPR